MVRQAASRAAQGPTRAFALSKALVRRIAEEGLGLAQVAALEAEAQRLASGTADYRGGHDRLRRQAHAQLRGAVNDAGPPATALAPALRHRLDQLFLADPVAAALGAELVDWDPGRAEVHATPGPQPASFIADVGCLGYRTDRWLFGEDAWPAWWRERA